MCFLQCIADEVMYRQWKLNKSVVVCFDRAVLSMLQIFSVGCIELSGDVAAANVTDLL